MKILVTGAGGFVGKYLVERILQQGHEIVTIGIGNMASFHKLPVRIYEIDILDTNALLLCMKKEMPDVVIHLAAISNVPLSWKQPALTIDVNVCGTINVLETLFRTNPNAKFINIGSSDEYGLAAKMGQPLTEDILCQPQNPYSISKYCAEQIVLQLGKQHDMNVIHTRSFNHFGPGQAKGFVTTDFACQIAAIEKKQQEPVLCVGNLEAYRDFLFVTDVVEAYIGLIETDVPSGVYNICSGKARRVKDILDMLVSYSKVKINIVNDLLRMRPSEVPFFVGNCDKLKSVIQWTPKYDFEQGMMDVLDYWRRQ